MDTSSTARWQKRPSVGKICTGCKENKPTDSYYKHKDCINGLNPRCISCKKKERLDSPGAGKGRNLLRYWPTCTAQEALENYQALWKAQQGLCSICTNKEWIYDTRTKRVRDLAVDHNAQTGTVRGLLCQDCNTGIGKFADNPYILEAAANYLRNTDG